MISVAEALRLIQSETRDFGTEMLPLESSIGRILADDVYADRDFPPFHRVTMDGIAISSTDWEAGCRSFRIAGLQAAGRPQIRLSSSGTCVEVMTGAVLPSGADIIIPYEDCMIDEGSASVTSDSVTLNQHVHLQGSDSPAGALLLQQGRRITPGVIAGLATVGKAQVPVRKLPRVVICSTGDELVDIAERPASYQIRRSNSYMIASALLAEGVRADMLHLPDDQAVMTRQLAGLRTRYDILLLSGAVSKGRLDFLPGVLAGLGMHTLFHRIAQRPGKPMLFGSFPDKCLVMGFPGNPVSTLVCYSVFFLTWLYSCLGFTPAKLSARLREDVHFKPSLTYHLPVRLDMIDGVVVATPCAGANSGDLVSLELADALVSLPPEKQLFKGGEAYPLTLLRPLS